MNNMDSLDDIIGRAMPIVERFNPGNPQILRLNCYREKDQGEKRPRMT